MDAARIQMHDRRREEEANPQERHSLKNVRGKKLNGSFISGH